MKGLLRGIGYFLLYVVFTVVVQVVLSMLIVQFAVGKGITDQGLIVDFANNNMLVGFTYVNGYLVSAYLYNIATEEDVATALNLLASVSFSSMSWLINTILSVFKS